MYFLIQNKTKVRIQENTEINGSEFFHPSNERESLIHMPDLKNGWLQIELQLLWISDFGVDLSIKSITLIRWKTSGYQKYIKKNN